ncbi:ADAM 12 protein [Catellatospora methionotrophica]|uniref:ADAM 12 protein n=1 Tax=Catellatospora methionotrophica TaxID=121620 RepID=UPI0033DFE542
MLRESLEPWCAAGVTGALRILDPPGGVVYVVDGRVAYAETPVASGVERLLTASGRLPADAWRAAVTAGRAQHRIGPELVDAGLVTQAELEALGVIALYDAAFFLFDLVVAAHFEHRARHPVGHLRTLDLRTVCQEVDRRKRLLADAWPDAAIDTAAVLPQRRLRSQCVALTALQWEVVANADRRRSPIDLARLLGRDTFTVMLEVRRMARTGLVEPGRPGGSAAAESVATVRARAAAGVPATATATAQPGRHAKPVAGPAPGPPPEPPGEPRPHVPLPRRAVRQEPDRRTELAGTLDTRVPEQILTRLIAGLGAL